ncbi:hypothetical protein [Polyangium jinanense]|uniref:Uncharacterized protein n=1 Tax=Polyangium jinanense TaxID=2829994 RepID=A0A9X3X505_9BACT|nr:hypothetical protein [Polyangium jinanense]MDC3958114.1 hypothetical protein [Polyangium jinanense]MDC3983687.1 hypothetical protein [Polyangium jinanense]
MGSERARGRARRTLVAWLLGFTTIVAANAVALAQSKTERDMARALMDEGDAKVEKKDFAGALRAYRAAHAIMGVPSTGIEVARTEEKLGHLVEAHKAALEVTRLPEKPGEPKPFTEAREAAKKLAAEIEPRIPMLTVVVRGVPESAPVEVKIDGVLVPSEAARAAQPVNPGKHEVSAAATGLPPVSKEIEIAEAQRQKVTLALGDAAASDDVHEPGRRVSPLVYVGFGVGGAGLIAGAVTGALSLSRAGTVGELCPAGTCPTQAALDEATPVNDSAKTLANVSNVAFALAVVGIGVGVAGIFLSGGEPKKSPETTSIRLNIGPTGIGLVGRF